jgi:hypothetical protein
VRYAVVMSLDGYIAGPKGEADWTTADPEFDFTTLFSQFDTILVGRKVIQCDQTCLLATSIIARSEKLHLPKLRSFHFRRDLAAGRLCEVSHRLASSAPLPIGPFWVHAGTICDL